MLPRPILFVCVSVLVTAIGGCAPARGDRTASAPSLTSAPLGEGALGEPPSTTTGAHRADTGAERISDPSPAEADASAVFRGMHDDLLACYRQRLRTHPKAHAFVTVDLLVGADGRVRDLTSTGGALLGRTARRCIEGRLRRAAFLPPRGGGTSRVRVPFAFHPDATEGAPGDRMTD